MVSVTRWASTTASFAADDLVERDELLDTDERAGAVVDEDVGDVGRQRGRGRS
jgi:hypothetical protein